MSPRSVSRVQERVIPLYEVMKNAAGTEPDVVELLTRMQEYRYSNITTIPATLAEPGPLRPGDSPCRWCQPRLPGPRNS